jgi:hypothetical protein
VSELDDQEMLRLLREHGTDDGVTLADVFERACRGEVEVEHLLAEARADAVTRGLDPNELYPLDASKTMEEIRATVIAYVTQLRAGGRSAT